MLFSVVSLLRSVLAVGTLLPRQPWNEHRPIDSGPGKGTRDQAALVSLKVSHRGNKVPMGYLTNLNLKE